jgi:hypothetical protein
MVDHVGLTPERAEALKTTYEDELLEHCGGHTSTAGDQIGWKAFKQYALAKEVGRCIQFLQLGERFNSALPRIMDYISRRT